MPIQQSHQLSVLAEISQLLTQPHDHDEVLHDVVSLVKKRLSAEVCSLYLLNKNCDCLILKATEGLNQEMVGEVQMRLDEGLTGLVVETMQPVVAPDAHLHPRYKFFPETGEEQFNSFMGVPLVSRNEPMGVLIIQHDKSRDSEKDDISMLVTIASQLASVVLNAELLQSIEKKEYDTPPSSPTKKEPGPKTSSPESDKTNTGRSSKTSKKISGIAGSQGLSIGISHSLQDNIDFSLIERETNSDIDFEIDRLNRAIEDSIQQISALMNKVQSSLSEEDSAIFHAHLMILEDKGVNRKMTTIIKDGDSAEWAVKEVISRYIAAFSEIEDPYLRERAMDMKDIGRRVVANLLGTHILDDHLDLPENAIIVAEDITPSQMVSLNMENIVGFILAQGGKTAHVSLLAKSFDIPALVGVGREIQKIKEHDQIILDCDHNFAVTNPPPEILNEYEKILKHNREEFHKIEELKELPATTTDGHEIKLLSNVGLLADLQRMDTFGSAGVGLYRTEFYFLAQNHLPGEEEQTKFYSNVLKKMEGRTTTIRTLDVGGDKFLPYLEQPEEMNPFLGWRSIRMSLDLQGIFRTQLRSLLRASVHGDLNIMFPMITGMEELLAAKKILQDEHDDLTEKGIPVSDNYKVGIMIEVPSAVRTASQLITESDFFSVGTNDLIQYTLAVDRSNPRVAKLFDALHPAILQMLDELVRVAKKAGKPLSICGEMAADPVITMLLVGLGIDQLSVISPAIHKLKKVIRSVSFEEAREVARRALELDTPTKVRALLESELDRWVKK
ncbi:MAG: phosphoenolpyruvate--protein phosphotransferase [Proteobacteria bacterium]|nr:phosphoenolpyruvate--protein phosphotransferase [Pseudomonadota bacterium]